MTENYPTTEFKLSKKKFLLNLIKLIPSMRKIRKKTEKLLPHIPFQKAAIHVPDSQVIQKDLEKICSVPHRRIGTKEAHEIEDFIEQVFKECGLEQVKKDALEVINWVATNWKLTVKSSSKTVEIPCFYVLNMAFTGKEGIKAPLVYVGTGMDKDFKNVDVKGKIVVADIIFPTLPLGKLLKLAKPYHVADPFNKIDNTTELILTFALTNFPPQALGGNPRKDSVYWRALQRGAAGLVLILKDYPTNINTHWGPYDGAMKDLPGVYVGKYDGMKLRELIQSEQCEGHLILEGYKEPSTAHNIWGILPGMSDDLIMISSHHDSAFQGASEDGTGVAMVLAQLRAWSQIPKSQRPYSLLFIITAGHLYGGIGAENFARTYKDSLLKKVLVDVNLEHACAKEVIEDPISHEFKFTNNLAMGAVFLTKNETIIAHTIKAIQEHSIDQMIIIPDNFFATPPIGEAGHFFIQSENLQIIHWIRSPYYLLTAEDTLDKIDMEKLGPTAQAVSDLINSLMQVPKDQFQS